MQHKTKPALIKKISSIHPNIYGLDILIKHKEKKEPLKVISLEEIIEQIPLNNKKEKYIGKIPYLNNDIILYTEFLKYLKPAPQNQNRDPKSRAFIFYVPPSYLPSGNGWRALGMYDPSTHVIYIPMTSLQKKQNLYIIMKLPMRSA